MEAPKKIVIVSYTFPPTPGIGGRRWAKFSKELTAAGHDIKVITFRTHYDGNQPSGWTKDIVSYKEKISYLASNYPKWLTVTNSFSDKVMYRLSLIYVKLFSKGNYYDRASFLRKKIISEVQSYINAGYQNVIVTCAPFKLSLWISELIDLNPEVNFIVDFRDPWANNLTAYGFKEMSDNRIDFEKNAEKIVVTKFNKIFVVANEMKNYFIDTYKISEKKIDVISNGFDVDDFVDNSEVSSVFKFNDNSRKKVVFTGTFYDNALYLLKELSDTLNRNVALKESFEFHFFGTMSNDAKKIVMQNSESFYFHGNVKLNQVYQLIRSSDYCSLFLTDDITYSLSTKFLEYLSQKKSILVFSKGGATGAFVETNSLGFSIEANNMEDKLINVLSDVATQRIASAFSIEDFNVTNLTKKIVLHLR